MNLFKDWDKKEKLNYLKNLANSEDKFYNDYTKELTCLLKDKDSEVRENAIKVLWDMPDKEFLNQLMELSEQDPEPVVRTKAISGLSRYMYELESLIMDEDDVFSEYEEDELSKEVLIKTKEYLIKLYQNPEKSIDERRHALEALGFLSEEKVDSFIRQAYHSDEQLFKISALFAMGRSGNIKWNDIILKEMHSDNKDIQFEAIRAAGELGLQNAAKDLLKLTYSLEKDIVMEAVWALGKTGWSDAFERLDELTMSSDKELSELAGAALDEWNLASTNFNDNQGDDEW